MQIVRTTFRNLKSYGNKTQQVTFDPKDRLILLTGTNGFGKSSILESISLSMFSIVNGKKDKKIPLKDLPNRINKNLYSSTEFYNNNNDYIKMDKYISPNKFKIEVNNDDYTEQFKLMTPEERYDLIGTNYNTFKSFISLDLNTFNDFISLNYETKHNLVNRLFDLGEIDDYFSTTTELIYQNKNTIDQLIIEINSIDTELKGLKSLIKKNSIKYDSDKNEIKASIIYKQKEYKKKKSEQDSTKEKISDLSVKLQDSKNKVESYDQDNYKKRIDLNNINKQLKLHDDGKCSYCHSTLDGDEHKSIYTDLKQTKDELLTEIENNDTLISKYKDDVKEVIKQKNILDDSLNYIMNELMEMKSVILSQKDKYDNYIETDNELIKELKSKGNTLIKVKQEKLNKITDLKNENNSLDILKDVLSETGIRTNIIESLIKPINETLKRYLEIIKFPYRFELNNEFNGVLRDKGDIINDETLSNGESRILNLCIGLSYIDMILKNNEINILFMDEVFSSISIENINELIKLLKQFSIDNEISLILVHHGLEQLDSKLFDKIITVEKKLFSDIKIN